MFRKSLYIYLHFILFLSLFRNAMQAGDCSPCKCEMNNMFKEEAICTEEFGTFIKIPEYVLRYNNTIQVLNFEGQKFTSLKTSDFTNFQQIEILNFYSNNINNIQPATFHNLPHLTSIQLSKNEIMNLTSGIFTNITNLKYLLLDSNKLNSLNSEIFTNLISLEEIHLNYNNISYIEKHCFVNVPNLYQIDLSNNKLITLQIDVFDKINKVEIMYLHGNPWRCDKFLCGIINKFFASKRNKETPICNESNKIWQKGFILDEIKLKTDMFMKKSIGENVVITCEITACSNLQMHWTVNQSILTDIINKNTNEYIFTSSINLNNLQLNDSGIYICKIIDINNYCREKITILEISEFQSSNTSSSSNNISFGGISGDLPELPDIDINLCIIMCITVMIITAIIVAIIVVIICLCPLCFCTMCASCTKIPFCFRLMVSCKKKIKNKCKYCKKELTCEDEKCKQNIYDAICKYCCVSHEPPNAEQQPGNDAQRIPMMPQNTSE